MSADITTKPDAHGIVIFIGDHAYARASTEANTATLIHRLRSGTVIPATNERGELLSTVEV